MSNWHIRYQPNKYGNWCHEFKHKLTLCDITPVQRGVGRALAEFADFNTGERCHPSIQMLHEYTGYSKSSILRAIDALSACGIISVCPSTGRGNIYTLHMPQIPERILGQCRERSSHEIAHRPVNSGVTVTPDTDDATGVTVGNSGVTVTNSGVTVTPYQLISLTDQTASRVNALGPSVACDLREEKSPDEPTSHLTHDQPLTRASEPCLAALDPQAPIEVAQEARERADDQIDVDREPRAYEPPPVRGLLASASDSMLGQEQAHSDERAAQARAMEDEAMSDEPCNDDWTPTIREIARKTTPEQRALRQERGPRDPISLDEMAPASLHERNDEMMPAPLQGLLGSDFSLSEKQAPSADALTPQEQPSVTDDEEWIVPDDAPEWMADLQYIEGDAERRAQLAMARAMYESRTNDAERRQRMRREYDAHLIIVEQQEREAQALWEQQAAEAKAKHEAHLIATAHDPEMPFRNPPPSDQGDQMDEREQAQGAGSVSRAASTTSPKIVVEPPNREAQAIAIKTLVHALEDCVARAGIDSGGRDVMMCLRPIVAKAIERGVDAHDVELEAVLRIQDASVADIRDERARFQWMIRALNSTLASLSPSRRDMSPQPTLARSEELPHEQRPIPKNHPCYGEEGIVTYGDLERANAQIREADPGYAARMVAEFHARLAAKMPKIKQMDLKTGKEITA